jgi:hypothetical protein
MKDVTIIIPVHEYNDTVDALLRKALESVSDCRKEFKDGHLPVVIVAPRKLDDVLTHSDIYQFIPETKIIWNEGNTDFCSMINFGVDNISTDYFSILEYDDTYRKKWFKLANDYFYGNESISIFLPLNAIHTGHKNWQFGNEFGLSNAFITDDVDDTDDVGIINFKRIEKCSVFNLTGAIFNRNDFIKVGKYKPSIKVAFNYELLLRLTNKGLKCMVVPKEGYVHEIGREGSLTDTYNKTLSDEEINKWFELAFREYVYDTDRNKDIINVAEEELK